MYSRVWVLIPAAVLTAYWPSLGGGLLWDDPGHITRPELRSLHGLWLIWSDPGATQQYYPLLHSAFWLEHRIWGDWLPGYRLANAALHSAAAVILVATLRRLSIPGALLAGVIFALHPVAVESVAWISEQKNTLSTVFYLASAYVYLDRTVLDRRNGTGIFRSPRYWAAFALFACALLSKSVTATLPAALLLVIWWKRGALRWRADVLPLVPWFGAAFAAGLFTIWFERELIGAQGSDFDLTLLERALLAGRVVWFYLSKLFWPAGLTFIYPRWTVDASQWWQYVYPAAAVVAGLLLWRRGVRGALAGYLFFCGTLVPALGFFDVYPFRFSFVADHFQYLACFGIIVPMAAALTVAGRRWIAMREVRIAAAAALIVLLGAMTWTRSHAYRDSETLYRDTIARNPSAWMAHQNLGQLLANQGRLSEAVVAFEAALRARADYPEARANLALAHMRLGDAAAASAGGEASAAANYAAVVRIDPDNFRAHYNLGTVLMDMPGRSAEAIAHLETAVGIDPESVEARVNLGIALAADPLRAAEAIPHLEYALSKRPDLGPVREILNRVKPGALTGGQEIRKP